MAGAVEHLTLDELARWAEETGRDLGGLDFTQPLKIAKVLIVADIKENFVGSHDPEGAPWPPLKRPRPNSKGADQPLRNTGLLEASVSAMGQGHFETITDHELIFGSNLDYAAIHNYGGMINLPERHAAPGKVFAFPGQDGEMVFTRKIRAVVVNIPQRQFLGISEPVEEKILLVFMDFVDGKL